MNTEDLLRHQGRTWQSPTVGAPDLTAALARRARRTRALAGSLTALVLLAGAGIWAVWPYPGGGSVAAVPAPTSDAATVAAIARDLAAAGSNGDEVTVTGEAVRTTAAASVAALDSSMGGRPGLGGAAARRLRPGRSRRHELPVADRHHRRRRARQPHPALPGTAR
jgi:hypothetical protein